MTLGGGQLKGRLDIYNIIWRTLQNYHLKKSACSIWPDISLTHPNAIAGPDPIISWALNVLHLCSKSAGAIYLIPFPSL